MKKSFKRSLIYLSAMVVLLGAMTACSSKPEVKEENTAEVTDTVETGQIKVENVEITKDDYVIPGVLTLPEVKDGEKYPAVIMLHGTGSNKDEVANQYVELAKELAENNIASIRIDFAGTGDSARDYSEYTISGAIDDAEQALAFLQGNENIDPERIGVLGYSQGGLIAIEFASRNDSIKSLATWAGTTSMAYYVEDHKDVYEAAKASEDGYAEMDLGFIKLNFSKDWFEEALVTDGLESIPNYKGSLLAINGAIDDVVVPETAEKIVEAATSSEDASVEIIEDADHLFRAFDEVPHPATKGVRDVTVSWFAEKL